MGYQLVFWQQEHDAPLPQDIYQALIDEQALPQLRPLPMDSIRSALVDAFPEMHFVPNADAPSRMLWDGEGQTSVEFWWSDLHLGAELRPFGAFSHDVANRVIDVLGSFGCPLYDPQAGERFDAAFDS